MVWDITTPLGSDAASLGDDKIRELKTDVQTALRGAASDGTEAKFPGSDTANPTYRYRGLKGTTGARPAFGDYGLYMNTTLNTIQRDSGTAWENVATLIPSGTVMVFYQAAAPVGWTQVVTQNDKALRVVSGGTGGTAGGTDSIASPPTHIHATSSHTLTEAQMPAHTHSLVVSGSSGVVAVQNGGPNQGISGGGPGGGSWSQQVSASAGSSNSHDHGNVSATTGFSPAYINVLIASKD